MLFSSPIFLFAFLPAVLLLSLVAPRAAKNSVLLGASLWFYAWGEELGTLLMLLTIGASWLAGVCAARARERGHSPRMAVLAIALFDFGLLFAFKYFDWLWQAAGDASLALGWTREAWPALASLVSPTSLLSSLCFGAQGEVRLPIGISFFIFQAFSYVVDVARGVVPAERNPLRLALYVSFFPQLIAGPIVRYVDVAAALRQRSVDVAGFAAGARRFAIGLAKKLLVADVLARTADPIFAIESAVLPCGVAWLGLAAYALQIYFDFSGYSDMAIGLGRMFGFRFLENFEHPYVSRSVTEFWRRWHISLSTWFRDYLYIPLGGNRRGRVRTHFNLLLVFAACGLWHGASFSFLVWGLWHGAFLVLERTGVGALLERAWRPLRHLYLLAVVTIGWVFFRADSLGQAWSYLGALFTPGHGSALLHHVDLYSDATTWAALAAGIAGSLPWVGWLAARRTALSTPGARALELAGHAALALVFAAALGELAGGSYSPFLYFRF